MPFICYTFWHLASSRWWGGYGGPSSFDQIKGLPMLILMVQLVLVWWGYWPCWDGDDLGYWMHPNHDLNLPDKKVSKVDSILIWAMFLLWSLHYQTKGESLLTVTWQGHATTGGHDKTHSNTANSKWCTQNRSTIFDRCLSLYIQHMTRVNDRSGVLHSFNNMGFGNNHNLD